MTFTRFLAAAALCLAASPTLAQTCRIDAAGARCVLPPEKVVTQRVIAQRSAPLVKAGDVVERGQYNLILNPEYYGLPPSQGAFVYMKIGPDVAQVDWQSNEVLALVTDQAAGNW